MLEIPLTLAWLCVHDNHSHCGIYQTGWLLTESGIQTPLELHLTTSELWFGQEQEGILP